MTGGTCGILRALALALVAAACTDDAGSTEESRRATSNESAPQASLANSQPAISTPVATGQILTSPAPTEMCGADASPALAAYDLATGAFKWAACASDGVRRGVLQVSDEAVYVEVIEPNTGAQQLVAYDASDGTELPDGSAAESQPTLPDRTVFPVSGIIVDGVRVEGGQDDPTTAVDDATGDVLWTHPGSPAYDDVWAVGDGAVYVIDRRSTDGSARLIAYELKSGIVRWEVESDPADVLWPWQVDGDVLLAIRTNLAVISTDDGSTVWRTQYPDVPFPRMTGVLANSDTVFVAFSSIPSGGD
jgi:outer membrane protein assembly factor BamB